MPHKIKDVTYVIYESRKSQGKNDQTSKIKEIKDNRKRPKKKEQKYIKVYLNMFRCRGRFNFQNTRP